MKDRSVRFTGVTLKASDLLGTFSNRKSNGPFPGGWERIEIPLSPQHYGNDFVGMMDNYIAANFESKWGVYINDADSKLVVFFEDGNDAVMFKLMDGQTAYLDTNNLELQ